MFSLEREIKEMQEKKYKKFAAETDGTCLTEYGDGYIQALQDVLRLLKTMDDYHRKNGITERKAVHVDIYDNGCVDIKYNDEREQVCNDVVYHDALLSYKTKDLDIN